MDCLTWSWQTNAINTTVNDTARCVQGARTEIGRVWAALQAALDMYEAALPVPEQLQQVTPHMAAHLHCSRHRALRFSTISQSTYASSYHLCESPEVTLGNTQVCQEMFL
jgi:hypothetical protein